MMSAAMGTDTLAPLRQRAVAAVLQRIAGRENEPAENVFQNVKLLKGVPAGRFLEIMNDGFGHGLGVGCGFCHVPGQFASDERPNKNVARDMITMVNRINGELRGMSNLPDQAPRIGCITCHRMARKPELIGTGH
jgi:photosynthetic reaction center cytochrome c subunit